MNGQQKRYISNVITLALGSQPRQRACKSEGQEGSLGVTFMLPGVQKSVREWTLTLSRELSFWELESRWTLEWTSEFSESNCIGQNSLDWIITYIIGKLLERRCLKWVCMIHLNIWNTSYSQKKGRDLNWQFDLRSLKVKNRLDFLACRRRAIQHWKALNEGYNFALNLISIGGLQKKLWAPKVTRFLSLRILGFPFGNPKTKKPLGCGSRREAQNIL